MNQRTYQIPRLGKVDVEKGVWFYLERSPGQRPDRDLANSLKWFLEQMLFEQFTMLGDAEDDVVVGLNIGIDHPIAENEGSRVQETEKRLQVKHLAMQLAGLLLANSRIEGVEPRYREVPNIVLRDLEDDVEAYTRYFFAFELIKTLVRIDELIHSLSVPPIKVSGFEDCWIYLSQATRCWLFGLHAASAALLRAALELALRQAIPRDSNLGHPSGKTQEGEQGLVDLIRAAHSLGILDNHTRYLAHEVRKRGNAILHGQSTEDLDSRGLLIQTRAVVEHIVCSIRRRRKAP